MRLERRRADEGGGLRGGRQQPAAVVVRTALAISRPRRALETNPQSGGVSTLVSVPAVTARASSIGVVSVVTAVGGAAQLNLNRDSPADPR